MQQKWSSGWVFLLAAIGSAVGLANIWRFPYMVGANGGGAFVLVYILSMLCIAIPMLISEVLMGRRGGADPVYSMEFLARESGVSPHWRAFGWLSLLATLTILCFYSVIAGWSFAYIPKVLGGLSSNSVEDIRLEYEMLIASPVEMAFWHGIFMFLTISIVSRGIQNGIETAVKVLMPGLFIILLVLVAFSLYSGGFEDALNYIFNPDFSKLNVEVVLMAIGSAFFSASVGIGAMMTYGAYLKPDVSVPGTAAAVAFVDMGVALLAGLAIFPIIFANGMDPDGGPGLVFVTLPIAFANTDYSVLLGTLFFALLAAASLTSAFSLLEPTVLWLNKNHGVKRIWGAWGVGLIVWLVGLGPVFSFNILKDFHPMATISRFEESTIFDLMDFTVTSIFLPLGAFMICIFIGWRMKTANISQELNLEGSPLFTVWYYSVKFLVPLALLAVFLGSF